MKPLVWFVVASCLSACATSKRPADFDQDDKRLLRSLGTTNGQVLGTNGTDRSSDFSNFTEQDYLSITQKGESLSRKQFREDYASLDAKEIISYRNTFVLCGFSTKLELAFCDDASCEGVEQKARSKDKDSISHLKSQIKNPGICTSAQ